MQFMALLFSGDIFTVTAGIVLLIGTGIVFWLRGKDSINEGEAGFVQRNGKVRLDKEGEPRLRGPGLILLIPWLDKLWRTSIQDRIRDLKPQQRETKRNGKLVAYEDVIAAVYFRVTEPILVLRKAEDLDALVVGICNSYLDELIRKGRSNDRIRSVFKNLVKADLAQYGVTFIDIKFQFGGHTVPTQFAITFAAAGVQTSVPFLPAAAIISNNGNGRSNGNGHHPVVIETP